MASELIEAYEPSALFLLIGKGHVTLVIYGLYRMGVRPTVEEKHPMFTHRGPALSQGVC